MKKNFLPIAINIAGEKILIIGGGQSAWKKIQIFKRFDASLEIVALTVCDEIKKSGISYREKAYEKADLEGFLLLCSCTNNPDLDRQIAADGKQAGVLVNIHDQPALCQFVSPAIYQQKNMRVAVSSNAEDVFESIRLRDEIKEYLENKNKTDEY
ncbi:precorrin-2 dehydrogenase/sirohydrochlorin ferrochelatase family protein [Gaoshiqia sp. Z1-71]|uniref:precorrin-2 dehydrogenase/sirohydrochlorin ferrochelatase family protein n=1 Tax=Gaoshiqia hydrogeniformans TaxID=3290090 RepID=UPI003BF909A3